MKSKSNLYYMRSMLFSAVLLCSCSKHNLTDARLGMGCCSSKSAENAVCLGEYELLGSQKQQTDGLGTPRVTLSTSSSSPSSAGVTQEPNSPVCKESLGSNVGTNGEQFADHNTPTTASTTSSGQGQVETSTPSTPVENTTANQTRTVTGSVGTVRSYERPRRTSSTRSVPTVVQVPSQINEVHSEKCPLLEPKKQQTNGSRITLPTSPSSSAGVTQEQNPPMCEEGLKSNVGASGEQFTNHNTPTTALTTSSSQGQVQTSTPSIPVENTTGNQTRTVTRSVRTVRSYERPRKTSSSTRSVPPAMQVPSQIVERGWGGKSDDKSRRSRAASSRGATGYRRERTFPQTSRVITLPQNIEFDENSVGSSLASLASIDESKACEFSFDEGVMGHFNDATMTENIERNVDSGGDGNGPIAENESEKSMSTPSWVKSEKSMSTPSWVKSEKSMSTPSWVGSESQDNEGINENENIRAN